MKKEIKTNAMRIVEKNNIAYKEYKYESDGFSDGITIAEKLNQPLEKTFKTLVTVGKSKKYYVFVVPVAKELDLKAAAASVNEKSVEMIPVKEITPITGYVRGGCSPIGMKKQFETVIDISAENQESIMFSAGKIGMQLEMSPADLSSLINGKFCPITK